MQRKAIALSPFGSRHSLPLRSQRNSALSCGNELMSFASGADSATAKQLHSLPQAPAPLVRRGQMGHHLTRRGKCYYVLKFAKLSPHLQD
ncbi:MAG: hypothetical protein LUB59_02590 [Candidatus Gastranaerophilales bacterium]|nr:hypothetical protein [Candidatus Gastranaerophilales bacterium]